MGFTRRGLLTGAGRLAAGLAAGEAASQVAEARQDSLAECRSGEAENCGGWRTSGRSGVWLRRHGRALHRSRLHCDAALSQ